MMFRHVFPVRLLMALAALAMIAAPAILADGGAAHAARMSVETMAVDHCAELPATDGDHRDQTPPSDCIAICLAAHSALASDFAALRLVPPPLRRDLATPGADRRVDHPPGIDPPPPRFA